MHLFPECIWGHMYFFELNLYHFEYVTKIVLFRYWFRFVVPNQTATCLFHVVVILMDAIIKHMSSRFYFYIYFV